MTTVQIEVSIDDKGVVQGTRDITSQFGQMGKGVQDAGTKHNAVFGQMQKNHTEAYQSLRLLLSGIGIQLPREVERVMVKLPGLQGAFKSAFYAGAILATAAAIGALVLNFDVLQKKIIDVEMAIGSLFSRGIREDTTTAKMDKDLESIVAKLHAAQNAAAAAGKEGFSKITEQLAASKRDLEDLQTKMSATINEKYPAGSSIAQREQAQLNSYINAVKTQLQLQANRDSEALERQHTQTLRDIDLQATLAGKNDLEKTRIQLAHDIQAIDLAATADKTGAGKGFFSAEKMAEIKKNLADVRALYQQYSNEIHQTILQENAASLSGFAQIAAETQAKIGALNKTFHDKWGDQFIGDPHDPENQARMDAWVNATADLQKAITATEAAGLKKRHELEVTNLEETTQLNEKAAIAMLPAWQQADAQIVAEFNDTQRKLQDALNKGMITRADYDQRLRDEAIISNRRMADDLAGQLQQTFDDITSGNIGKTIVKNFEKLFFQIVAQWIVAQRSMQGAAAGTGGGGGLFGALLGPLLGIGMPGGVGGGSTLGIPGMGGGYPGGAGGGLPGGVINNFMAGGSTLGGGGGIIGGGSTAGMGGGSVDSSTSVILRGVPGIGGISGGAGGASGGGGLSGLLGMLPMAGGLLGSKVGGIAGAVGMGLAGLGIAASLQNSQALALVTALGLSPAIVAAGAGGLTGFGVGMQYGKLPGALSGVGVGALTGFMVGGPIGALIGGIAGLLGGLFGGWFGGSKRRKQAEAFAQQQEQDIGKIEAAYKSFQLDYPSAMAQLEAIRTNAYDQLRQLKGEGKSVFSKTLSPYIDKVEAEMLGFQSERDRRATLAFAPPQFATGGTVTAGFSGTHGGVMVEAHAGEEIINPAASARNRSLLKAINSGEQPSSSGDGIQGVTITDGRTFVTAMMNAGLWTQIKGQAKRDKLEGR
jgi:hypothetical protein